MASTLYQFKADLKGLVDLEKKLKQANIELSKLKKNTDAYAKKTAQIKTVGKQMGSLQKSMGGATKASNKMNRAGGKLVNTFKSAAVAIASAFAVRAIVGSVKGAIGAFMDFERQMSAVKAISGATNKEFKELEQSAKDLGNSTVFTATQVAELQEEFARLGFSAAEIKKVQKATLDLAAATGESLANSAQTAGSVLRAYNLEAEQTQRVTDTMAVAFTNSALNLEKFKESMKFVAPVARATGFTLEETSSLLMELSNNGLSGSLAGNALKNVFLRLGDANSKLSKKLGGTVQGLPDLIEAMKKLKDEGFGATEAVDLLDKRSAPAFLSLIKNIDGLQDSVDILHQAEGATAAMAAIRLDNLAGDMTLLKSATEGLGIALTEEFDIGLRNSLYTFTRWIQEISNSESALRKIRNAVNLLSAVLAGLAARFITMGMISFVKGLIMGGKALRTMVIATRAATTATQGLKVMMASTPWGFIAQAVTTVAAAFFMMGEEASEAEMKTKRMQDALEADLVSVLKHNIATEERAALVRQLANDFPELLDMLDIEMATTDQLRKLKEEVGNLDLTDRSEEKAAHRERIDELQSFIDLKQESVDRIEKLRYEASLMGQEYSNIVYKQTKDDMARMRNQRNQFMEEQKIEKASLDNLVSGNLNKIKKIKTFNGIILDGANLKRTGLEMQYLKELAAFRKMNDTMQELTIDKATVHLKSLEAISKYNNFIGEGAGKSQAQVKLAKKNADDFYATLEGPLQKAIDGSKKSIQEINIELSVYRKFVTNLDAALRKSGKTMTGDSALSGVLLQKTKDNYKDLIKVMDGMIEDTFVKMSAATNNELTLAKAKYAKQTELSLANTANMKTLLKEGNTALISATIKANKTKYDAIKTLTTQQYNDAISGEAGHNTAIIQLLKDMLDEEVYKRATNDEIVKKMKAANLAELAAIEAKSLVHNAEASLRATEAKTKATMRGEKDAFKAISTIRRAERDLLTKNLAHVESESVRQLAIQATFNARKISDNQAALDLELIDENEFLAEKERLHRENAQAIERINTNKSTKINDLNATDNDSEVAAFQEKLAVATMYYNTAFDAFSTFMNNKWELEMQNINEQRDIRQQELSDELEQKLIELDGNEVAQENLRVHYAELERISEQKREEELRVVKKKQFQMKKANDIIQAIINGAVAITTVAGQTGIGAIAMAPLMSAFVAAQIAAIASQKFVGARGGIIPGGDDKFAKGGMVVGPRHAQGGVKFNVGGRVSELEGGEAVINRRSTAMYGPELSAMNVAGGGRSFEAGGVLPGVSNRVNEMGFGNMDTIITGLGQQVVAGVNSKQVIVTESSITSSQANVSVAELTSSIF